MANKEGVPTPACTGRHAGKETNPNTPATPSKKRSNPPDGDDAQRTTKHRTPLSPTPNGTHGGSTAVCYKTPQPPGTTLTILSLSRADSLPCITTTNKNRKRGADDVVQTRPADNTDPRVDPSTGSFGRISRHELKRVLPNVRWQPLPLTTDTITSRRCPEDVMVGSTLGFNGKRWHFVKKRVDQHERDIHLRVCNLDGIVPILHSYPILDSYDPQPLHRIIMPKGKKDLFDCLHDKAFDDPSCRLNFFKDILSAVRNLHKVGIVHLDIKLDNIFVYPHGQRYEARLGDFGLSRTFEISCGDEDKTDYEASTCGVKSGSFGGSIRYVAPEHRPTYCLAFCRKGQRPEYSRTAADIWTLGFLLYILLKTAFPWEEREFEYEIEDPAEYMVNKLSEHKRLHPLIRGLCHLDIKRRLSAKKASDMYNEILEAEAVSAA